MVTGTWCGCYEVLAPGMECVDNAKMLIENAI